MSVDLILFSNQNDDGGKYTIFLLNLKIQGLPSNYPSFIFF